MPSSLILSQASSSLTLLEKPHLSQLLRYIQGLLAEAQVDTEGPASAIDLCLELICGILEKSVPHESVPFVIWEMDKKIRSLLEDIVL